MKSLSHSFRKNSPICLDQLIQLSQAVGDNSKRLSTTKDILYLLDIRLVDSVD